MAVNRKCVIFGEFSIELVRLSQFEPNLLFPSIFLVIIHTVP